MRFIISTASQRILADGRFAGEHAGVGAVEDRVGHVGRFGPRRPRRVLHAVEHLRGDDHRPLIAAGTCAMIRFCSIGIWATSISTPKSPRATITASAACDDLFQPLERFALFDLGDDAGGRAARPQHVFQRAHVIRRADEAEADEIDARLGRPDRRAGDRCR